MVFLKCYHIGYSNCATQTEIAYLHGRSSKHTLQRMQEEQMFADWATERPCRKPCQFPSAALWGGPSAEAVSRPPSVPSCSPWCNRVVSYMAARRQKASLKSSLPSRVRHTAGQLQDVPPQLTLDIFSLCHLAILWREYFLTNVISKLCRQWFFI